MSFANTNDCNFQKGFDKIVHQLACLFTQLLLYMHLLSDWKARNHFTGLVLKTIWNLFSGSATNIDLLSAAFFSSKFVVLYLWFAFFAQSLLLFNFWPIHNGCCVSETGWSWTLGLRAQQRRNERRRLTKSLRRAPATMQKRDGDYLPQWKEEQILADSSKACVCDPGWQRIIWSTIYLELQVPYIWRAQTAAAP